MSAEVMDMINEVANENGQDEIKEGGGESSWNNDLGIFADEDDTDTDTDDDVNTDDGDGDEQDSDDVVGPDAQDENIDDADDDSSVEDEEEEEQEDEDEDGESEDDDDSVNTDAISVESYMLAAQRGLTKDQAEAFGSEKALLMHLSLTANSQQQAVAKGDTEEQEEEVPEFKIDLGNEEEYDEKLVASLKAIEGEVNSMRKAERKELQELKAQLVQEQQLRFIDNFETEVRGLDEYSDELGTGSIQQVTDEQASSRQKVFETVRMLQEMSAKSNAQEKALPELVKEAATIVFKDKIEKNIKKKVVRAASRKKVRKPSTSKTQKLDGESEEDILQHIEKSINSVGGRNKQRGERDPFGTF